MLALTGTSSYFPPLTYLIELGITISMLSKDLIAASSKPLILSILADGENYGYAIIERVRDLSAEQIHWSEGMLYPVLHRLEKEGLIASRWVNADGGRERRYYRLKPEGRRALESQKTQ